MNDKMLDAADALAARTTDLREAQKVYMMDRGNQEKGRAVGQAAEAVDAALGEWMRVRAWHSHALAELGNPASYEKDECPCDEDHEAHKMSEASTLIEDRTADQFMKAARLLLVSCSLTLTELRKVREEHGVRINALADEMDTLLAAVSDAIESAKSLESEDPLILESSKIFNTMSTSWRETRKLLVP